jgi:hypothetical protein
MGVVVVNAPLLPMPNQLPSALIAQCQSFGSFGKGKGYFHGGWHPNSSNGKGHMSDFYSFNGSSNNDWRQGNWQ